MEIDIVVIECSWSNRMLVRLIPFGISYANRIKYSE